MTNHHSKIEKLITELCPYGVEYNELGEVTHYSKTRIAASELHNENHVGVDNLLPNMQGKTFSSYVPKKQYEYYREELLTFDKYES